MAKPRSNEPIEPMDLANMRQNGVRSLAVQCRGCRHEVIMNVDHLAGDVRVPSLGPKMVCTKCRRAAELAGEGEAMKRPAKQPSQPASKSSKWDIYHIKGTPAALLGRVEAPDEETAIRKAVDEFGISPALQKKASRAAAVIARIAVRLAPRSHPSE